ncbi:glycine zipper family protein [Rhodopila globiformis]|nr:glycine zipper family protein [Rhodopila globiformis]
MRFLMLSATVLAPLLLDACATHPMSPTVGVMPPPGKPFETFRTDEAACRDAASRQVQGGAQQPNTMGAGSAPMGTLPGTGLGTAGGTAGGAGVSRTAQLSLQQRYDLAYSRCIYARGNQVPGYLPPGASWSADAPGHAP